MNPEVEALRQQLDNLQQRFDRLERLDRYQMEKPLMGGTRGLHIAPSGKLSFFGKAPIAQQASITAPSGGATVDGEARTAISSVITSLKNVGLIQT